MAFVVFRRLIELPVLSIVRPKTKAPAGAARERLDD
jgi:hypothetical protein